MRKSHSKKFKAKVALEALKEGVKRYFIFYNTERFHQSLGYVTPEVIIER